MPINYQLGKIYKIVCNITGNIYIGSTCEPSLARRLAGHVSNYKSYLNGKTNYITSYKIIEQGDYDIILIENYPCNSKDELHARESHFTQTIPCVNKVKNQGLLNNIGKVEYDKQYYNVNKDQILEQMTQNYQKNKDQLIEKVKQHYQKNKDRIIEKKKQHYQKNKDRIIEKKKQHYQKNKDQILERKNTKHTCHCGGCFTSANKARHYMSPKHQNYEQNKLYYNIQHGLDIINKLDKHFNKI